VIKCRGAISVLLPNEGVFKFKVSFMQEIEKSSQVNMLSGWQKDHIINAISQVWELERAFRNMY
jgi:hypothetical protein